ncbi:MAG: EAL domain-containing protein [Gammaproteobacteria bacterium]|jgi:diguanylate cyclase (GGDEF)-like protein|nr:EAL domain-containing protein [Gammaproteobacteria bacterium]
MSVNIPWSRLPVVLSVLVLLTALAASFWFYRSLESTQAGSVDRHVADLIRYVQNDLAASLDEQLQAHRRQAARLKREGIVDQAGWRADTRLFRSHYPFYRSLAVLDPDLGVRWGEGVGTSGDARYPLDEHQLELKQAVSSGEMVVLEPHRLTGGKYAVTLLSPIGSGGGHLGYLAAEIVLADAVKALISDRLRDELVLRVYFGDQQVYPHESVPRVDKRAINWQEAFSLDLDGDGTALRFSLAMSDGGLALMNSDLPRVALISGIVVSALLALTTYLVLNATRQARSLKASNQELEHEIRERELAEQELEFLVTHDPLTGLPNRTGSTRYLERIIRDVEREGGESGQLALMFLDLDQFKDINDSLGHQIGDRLLCEVPRRLSAVLKEHDFVGRHGGDEFLIAVVRSGREEIEQLAVTLLRSMDRGFAIDDNHLFVSASIGMAYFPDTGRDVSELIQNADAALFKAKNAGRNQFATFTREMFSQAQHRLTLSRDMRHALDAGQFKVVYQPIVDTGDLSLCGLEALLRWRHEKGYMVPPQDFIRVAEETGVIGRLGQFVLEQALADLAHWQTLTDSAPWLAVNMSGAQVREVGLGEQLSVLLHRYRIDPGLLHLEITEEVLIENLMRNRRTLQKLDEIGMRIVVDDFGVGYSSLAYLKNFPVSVVKIDRGFVQDLSSDPEDQAITRTICSLSADLGMLTVAEGVEHRDQLDLLRQFKCSFAQGFLFSRAVDAVEVETLLRQKPLWLGVAS